MGYNFIDMHGLHSIQKRACTYIASLPGGPPPAALQQCAVWSMGPVKYIYYHQSQGRDKFDGCYVSMLNMMSSGFQSSLAYFEETTGVRVYPRQYGLDGKK